jgi:D-arabinose 1-dehydrogenase-like Zn-dependent alcohol dehydrogenase
MKAMQFSGPGADLELVEIDIPEPDERQVLIKVEACGICHGDAIVKQGYYPGLTYPRTPGHEVVGVIEKVGSENSHWQVGQRVGVGWRAGACGQCVNCRKGDFYACQNPLATGISVDGGYAEYMVARSDIITMIPDDLSSVEAAPLLCAGSTTLGALKALNAKPGDLVAIHGMGGLGHLALQFAVHMGFDTAVLSRGTEKEELARSLGAHHFIDTEAGDPAEALSQLGGAKGILCTAPNAEAIANLVGGLARFGQMLIITFVNEPMSINPGLLMRKVCSVGGWIGGNMADTIKLSILTKVVPMVETFPLERAQEAFDKMMSGTVHFRSVLTIGGENDG